MRRQIIDSSGGNLFWSHPHLKMMQIFKWKRPSEIFQTIYVQKMRRRRRVSLWTKSLQRRLNSTSGRGSERGCISSSKKRMKTSGRVLTILSVTFFADVVVGNFRLFLIFVPFHSSGFKLNQLNSKKNPLCARDSNPVPLYGRHCRTDWAMVTCPYIVWYSALHGDLLLIPHFHKMDKILML